MLAVQGQVAAHLGDAPETPCLEARISLFQSLRLLVCTKSPEMGDPKADVTYKLPPIGRKAQRQPSKSDSFDSCREICHW